MLPAMNKNLGLSCVLVALSALVACGDSTGSGGGGSGAGGSGAGTPEGGGGTDAGGSGTGGAGGAAPGTPCEEICAFDDSLEETFMCGYSGATCVGDCEAGFAGLPAGCDDEAIAYNDCLMAQDPSDFNCTDGIFTLTTDACSTELDALTACTAGA